MAGNEDVVKKILWFCSTALVTSVCAAVAAFLAITLGDGHDTSQVIAFLVGVPLVFVGAAWMMYRQAKPHDAAGYAAAGALVPLAMMLIGLA